MVTFGYRELNYSGTKSALLIGASLLDCAYDHGEFETWEESTE